MNASKSNVNESNVIKLKTISLNINENINEYLLVMNASWLMVEYIAFAMLTYIVIMLLYDVYRYYYLYV